ncbi:MAG: hypothetical protein KAY22_18570 [Rhizorhabdus sp.]|uniref:hypothetical protein n=1 Tax=Rhizorhabdus sp. TaxID=1968843 RepID=UPI001B606F24|nr:hypothetical protein [Rhizorhabdus sp.]MBP8234304.1 hypothetical protein [Rhizorhabdus sp.]
MVDDATSEAEQPASTPFARITAQIIAEMKSGKIRRFSDIEQDRQFREQPGSRVTNVLRGSLDR